MKRKGLLFGVSLLLGASSLIGCAPSSSGYTVPTTSYQKVKTAFNGVEKSFQNRSNKNSLAMPSHSYIEPSSFNDALNTIYNEYTLEETGGSIEDLEYDEPPMIQFRYLKSVLEKVGEGYSFGTKYQKDITGQIYFDLETGEKKESTDTDYLVNYTFTFAVEVGIDENDLIDASVHMGVNLAKGNDRYHTDWYVSMLLDYDMEKESPNYKMTIITDNDEHELSYLSSPYNIGYYYVEVENNSIKEWRKFDIGSNKRLVKDSTHQDFASYINEGVKFVEMNWKWYKNNTFHKFTSTSATRLATLGEAFFNGMGLNTTNINPNEFISKRGTPHNALEQVYREISQIYGVDIIYDLIKRGEDHGEGPQTITGMKILSRDSDNEFYYQNVSGNHSIKQLFAEQARIAYMSDDNKVVEVADNDKIDGFFTYKFTIVDEEGNPLHTPIEVYADTQFKEAYLDAFGDMEEMPDPADVFTISVYDRELELEASCYCILYEVSPYDLFHHVFPKVLANIGVPAYKSQNAYYILNQDEKTQVYSLEIANTNSDEIDQYCYRLVGNEGFTQEKESGEQTYMEFTKVIGNSTLHIRIPKTYSDSIRFEIWQVGSSAGWPTDVINRISFTTNFPAPVAANAVYDVNEDAGTVVIRNLTQAEYNAYVSALNDFGRVILDSHGNISEYRYVGMPNASDHMLYVCPFSNEGTVIYLRFHYTRGYYIDQYQIRDDYNNLVAKMTVNEDYDGMECTVELRKGTRINMMGCNMSEIIDDKDRVKESGTYHLAVYFDEEQQKMHVLEFTPGEVIDDNTYLLIGSFNNWSFEKGYVVFEQDENEEETLRIDRFSFVRGNQYKVFKYSERDGGDGLGYSNVPPYEYIAQGENNNIACVHSFTATVTLRDNYIYFDNIQDDGSSTLDISSVSIVGSFNEWNLEKGTKEFTVDPLDGGHWSIVWTVDVLTVDKPTEFKVVLNHNWSAGTFGYDQIDDVKQYINDLGKEKDNGNIIVQNPMVITIDVYNYADDFRISLSIELMVY